MKIIDDKLTTLAKKIEPFVKKFIREMIYSGGSTNDQTFFYGTGFPKSDTLGTRGTDAVDFQLNRDTSAQVAGGARSCILGGQYNRIDAAAYDSIVGGSGGWAYKNPCAWIMGNYIEDYGDAQSGHYTEKAAINITSSWQDIAAIYMRENSHITFNALILGAEASLAKQYGYRVEGSVTNEGGAMTLNYSLVTPLYESETTSSSPSVSPSVSPSGSVSPSASISPSASVSISESVSASPSA